MVFVQRKTFTQLERACATRGMHSCVRGVRVVCNKTNRTADEEAEGWALRFFERAYTDCIIVATRYWFISVPTIKKSIIVVRYSNTSQRGLTKTAVSPKAQPCFYFPF